MKIAQINTHVYGGASIVAKRIHQSLLEIQIDSILVTKFGIAGDIPKHIFFRDGRLRKILLKIISNPAIIPVAEFILDLNQHPNLAGRPKGFEIFSPLCLSVTTSEFDVLKDRDIIHLHWINDFFEYESFFKRFSDKKFVWTLHDMNPITGGCHHSDECLKFESVCLACPQLKNTIDENYSKIVQDAKINALKHLKDEQLIVASPSVWLLELSRKSQIMGRFRHILVHNPSFKDVSLNTTKDNLRKKLGLPADKKIVLFASGNLNNTRKGIAILFQAVRLLERKKDILLVGIGHKAKRQAGLDIIYTGSLSNVELLASYFYAADIFVTPSLAENSPLVVIESLCCGTPVVASDVGGIPDLINNDNGILFPTGNIPVLVNAIASSLFEKKFDREKIRQDAISLHSPTKIALDYLNVYKSFKD